MFRSIDSIVPFRILAALAAVAVTLLLACVPVSVLWFAAAG
ncbi:MAG TPA: hypothetical protein VFS13_07355 [Steroidobacteraceae bacterium]|jgi:hypothetical protein|nr:hypothetical protein [Steroidobacteraceae bacterium]